MFVAVAKRKRGFRARINFLCSWSIPNSRELFVNPGVYAFSHRQSASFEGFRTRVLVDPRAVTFNWGLLIRPVTASRT
jgi:hypothetical protein